ncbi:MAG: hypothetical protein ABSA75_02955 [Candidatus Bathyarchaeia archaeon]|jgi:hypothetical protein
MRYKYLTASVIAVALIISSLFIAYSFSTKVSAAPKVYVGVDIAYSNVTAVEYRIDQVSSYANLIVIGSTDLTGNLTCLKQVCQYAYDRNIYFMIYTTSNYVTKVTGLEIAYDAKAAWGNRFLGLYAGDETGGKQLDRVKAYGDSNNPLFAPQPNNYSEAENQFVSLTNSSLNTVSQGANLPLFTSDYALYWFDYKAGYDAVFTEFGWNNSRQMDIVLCRGAATVQGKNWGVIITWTYDKPPYLESGTQLLSDMKLAYDNGAKYIILFDSDGQGGGILGTDQLNAIQQFWQYAKANPSANNMPSDRVAYVLPNNYGYGFHGPDDSIWGVWQADNFTDQLYANVNNAMQQYGNKLDAIYDDPSFPNYTNLYSKLIFWNGTIEA